MPSKLLETKPKSDGFVMPAEYEPQESVWICMGGVHTTWHSGGYPIRKTQVELAKAILKAGTAVNVAVTQDLYLEAEFLFKGMDVSIYEMSLDNNWPRDMGAITVKNRESGEIRGVDFLFNGWGGEQSGAMPGWEFDNMAARKMLQCKNLDRYKADFIFEGGSVTTDGEGTAITTKSCLLNSNRNPEMSKLQIEQTLYDYLGFEKIIWLDEGIDCGEFETDGHVDDICAFIGPAEVVACYTEDTKNEYHDVFKKCYEQLISAVDAKGRRLKVHKLTACRPFKFTKEESENILVQASIGKIPEMKWRNEGDYAVPNYANFLITNGTIIFPVYNVDTDEEAVKCIKKIVGNRYKVEVVNAHEIALNGGSIHCFTQQVSK